jgi:cell wall-associated NlpC family hydrolase
MKSKYFIFCHLFADFIDMKYVNKTTFIILFFVFSCIQPQPNVKKTQSALSKQNSQNSIVKNVLRSSNLSDIRKSIIRTADSLQGAPYLPGGSSPKGFDCSGFVRYVYGKSGISILRSTDQQYMEGRKISLDKAKSGDLVFFQTSSEKISHVGIYVGDGMFIHAPSSGKSVSYTSMENPYWKPRYRGSVSYIR